MAIISCFHFGHGVLFHYSKDLYTMDGMDFFLIFLDLYS